LVKYELCSDNNGRFCLLVKTDLGWKEFNMYTDQLDDVIYDFVDMNPAKIFDRFRSYLCNPNIKIITVVEHGDLQF